MRRVLLICAVIAGIAVLFVGSAAGGDEETYEVRAIFDNASFLVPGEDVRIAGANVGRVKELGVTGTDEAARANGEPEPGKAFVVLEITDPAFQDFREDASCIIRPQSLIGEKFVECEATQPRAAGSEAPPELEPIPEGEPGEGQVLLPLENNGKSVDLDLINNIMDAPYPDRFRLIFNELGASLAARGDELAEIVERANPALRETNRVLAILARQNRRLADLASDSDAIFSALARERESVASFINEAVVAGSATAERRADLEESFQRFPGFLRELRATMRELDAFNRQARPVFADLRGAAPALTRVNELLDPFSRQGTRALTSLGDAAEASGSPLVESDPVIRDVRNLAEVGAPAARNLSQFFTTFRKTDGFRHLLNTVYGLGGSVNAFDQFGHFLRTVVPLNVCFDYYTFQQSGCENNFHMVLTESASRRMAERVLRRLGRGSEDADEGRRRGTDRDVPGASGSGSGDVEIEPTEPEAEADDQTPAPDLEITPEAQTPEAASGINPKARVRAMRELYRFMVGPRGERTKR